MKAVSKKEKVNVEKMANQLVDFLKAHDLSGIHLSFEQDDDFFNSSKLMVFLQKLKELWPEIIISAQVFPVITNEQVQYSSSGTTNLYQDSIIAGVFNFLCLKAYGNPGILLTSDGQFCSADRKNECINQTLPEFMTAAFQAFKRLTPLHTQIFVYQPASEKRAQIGSVFQGPQAATAYQEWAKICTALDSDPQFGGVSTEVLSDAENDFQLVKALTNPSSPG
jgi:hypothetical protein